MRNTDWPPAEIQRIASASGKPLEVKCAEALLAAGWTARLGSYYADGALDVPRELDVLAEKSVKLDVDADVIARVRTLVSCRGFPAERSPLVYSVSETSVPSYEPRLLVEHRGPRALEPGAQLSGPCPALEIKSARRVLKLAGLETSRPIVAFDMIERTDTTNNNTLRKSAPQSPVVTYTRAKDGDSILFKAVDSAIKAAFFWRQEDYQKGGNFITVNVPLCVLSLQNFVSSDPPNFVSWGPPNFVSSVPPDFGVWVPPAGRVLTRPRRSPEWSADVDVRVQRPICRGTLRPGVGSERGATGFIGGRFWAPTGPRCRF